MKFGAVPVRDANGAILAHSVSLLEGRLRKGKVLNEPNIAALIAKGYENVVVAQLETRDIGENEAARRIADALVAAGAGLSVTRAATGRVNILADGAGVAAIGVPAINALNTINPMITVATVSPYARMIERGMVATVKIISYGVAEVDVEAACLAGQDALGLHQPQYKTASFIQTTIQPSDSQKGTGPTQKRLAALGVEMIPENTVSHDVIELSKAIQTATGDVILILTASATSDIQDTAPSALIAAGGRITTFGMPVDPGNLLFTGQYRGKPVIGLPGCARSPALNGADWVLERTLCGVKVTAEDISGMGVGGLLKEISSRPQPRSLNL